MNTKKITVAIIGCGGQRQGYLCKSAGEALQSNADCCCCRHQSKAAA